MCVFIPFRVNMFTMYTVGIVMCSCGVVAQAHRRPLGHTYKGNRLLLKPQNSDSETQWGPRMWTRACGLNALPYPCGLFWLSVAPSRPENWDRK